MFRDLCIGRVREIWGRTKPIMVGEIDGRERGQMLESSRARGIGQGPADDSAEMELERGKDLYR